MKTKEIWVDHQQNTAQWEYRHFLEIRRKRGEIRARKQITRICWAFKRWFYNSETKMNELYWNRRIQWKKKKKWWTARDGEYCFTFNPFILYFIFLRIITYITTLFSIIHRKKKNLVLREKIYSNLTTITVVSYIKFPKDLFLPFSLFTKELRIIITCFTKWHCCFKCCTR